MDCQQECIGMLSRSQPVCPDKHFGRFFLEEVRKLQKTFRNPTKQNPGSQQTIFRRDCHNQTLQVHRKTLRFKGNFELFFRIEKFGGTEVQKNV